MKKQKTNVVIVGGGKGGEALVRLFYESDYVRISGICDIDKEAPGIKLARELGVPASSDCNEYLNKKDVDEIINVTGSDKIQEDLTNKFSPGIEVVGGHSAKLFWEIIYKLQETQEKYEEQYKFLQNVIKSISSPFYVIDVETYEVLFSNCSIDKLRNKHSKCFEVSHNLIAPCGGEHVCPLSLLRQTKKPVVVNHTHYDEDGNERFVEIHAYPIFNDTGNVKQAIEYTIDITERKKIEKKLQDNEQRYAIAAKQTGQLIYDYDVTTGKIKWIGAIEEVTGFSFNEFQLVTVDKWGEMIHPEDREEALRILNESEKKVGKYQANYRFRKKNDTYIYIHDEGIFLADKKGKAYRMVGAMRDITQEKQIEKTILEEKDFTETAINSLPGVFYVFDETGKFYRWNKNFENITGYSSGEISKMTPGDFFAEKDRKNISKAIQTSFSAGEVTVEGDLLSKNGKKTPYYFTGYRVIVDQNPYLVGAGIDMTELKRAEEDLKLSEEMFKTMFDNASDVICLLDKTGKIQKINKAASGLSGYSMDYFNGKSFQSLKLFPAASMMKMIAAFARSIMGRDIPNYEVEAVTKPGDKIILSVHAAPYKKDGKVQGVVCVLTDVTEKAQTNEKIEFLAKFPSQNPNPIFRISSSGVVLYCNVAGGKVLKEWGVKEGDKMPYNWCSLVKETLHSGGVTASERTVGGRILSFTITPLTEEGYVNFYGKDVTDLRRAQEKMRESEEKFRSLYTSSMDAIMLLTPEEGFFGGNPAAVKLFGCKSEKEFTTKTPAMLSPKFQPDGQLSSVKAQEMMQTAYREGSHFFHWTHKKVDGTDFPATVLLTKMELGDRTILQATVRDITQEKENEEALKKQRDELQLLFNKMLNAFVIFDSVFDKNGKFTSYRFVYINEAYERITGVKNEDVKGKTVHEVWPETEDSWIEAYGNVAVTGVPRVFDMFHGPTNKLYHCNVYRPGASKNRFCVIFEDITERQKLQSDLKKHIRELEVFYEASKGREKRIIELKKKVKELEGKLRKK